MKFLTKHEVAAFWSVPLAGSLFLIPWFAVPLSPLFLGRLVPGENIGVGLSAVVVLLNGSILGYSVIILFSLPVYVVIRNLIGITLQRMYLLAGVSGILASFVVRSLHNFKQPLLRSFADSIISPLIGLFCGLGAGILFSYIAARSIIKEYRERTI